MRFLTAVVAMLSILYMQFAVASYVCPGTLRGGGNGTPSFQATMMDMPDCQGMDAMQPQLCYLYAHGGLSKQSVDKTPAPDVPPFVPATLVLDLQFIDAVLIPEAQPYRPIALTRTTAPPVAIRNCCFRI